VAATIILDEALNLWRNEAESLSAKFLSKPFRLALAAAQVARVTEIENIIKVSLIASVRY